MKRETDLTWMKTREVIRSTHVEDSAKGRLTRLVFLFCTFHNRRKEDYFLSSANENMDLIHREMDWGMGHECLLGFDMSLFSESSS